MTCHCNKPSASSGSSLSLVMKSFSTRSKHATASRVGRVLHRPVLLIHVQRCRVVMDVFSQALVVCESLTACQTVRAVHKSISGQVSCVQAWRPILRLSLPLRHARTCFSSDTASSTLIGDGRSQGCAIIIGHSEIVMAVPVTNK